MLIVAIEGLSLTGKTTTCEHLLQYYSEKGLKCVYKPRGHLTIVPCMDEDLKRADLIIKKWEFKNDSIIHQYIDYGLTSLNKDFSKFLIENQAEFDIIFLDRHFTGQYVTADYFGYKYTKSKISLENYYQFILLCSYEMLLMRSAIRRDNHSRLTDFTLMANEAHDAFQNLYETHATEDNYTVLCNDLFDAEHKIIQFINSKLEKSI